MDYSALKARAAHRHKVEKDQTHRSRSEKAKGSEPVKGTTSRAAASDRSDSSDHNLQVAKIIARNSERERWTAVMLDKVAEGRERIAAALLSCSDDSADAIKNQLAKTPTVEERKQAKALKRQASAAAIWDRAINQAFGKGEPA